jgi:hypothetical protein
MAGRDNTTMQTTTPELKTETSFNGSEGLKIFIDLFYKKGNTSLFGILQDDFAKNSAAGLPDFSWYNKPKHEKIYQMTTNDTKLLQTLPKAVKYSKWQ